MELSSFVQEHWHTAKLKLFYWLVTVDGLHHSEIWMRRDENRLIAVLVLQAALSRGLLPDDETLQQLKNDKEAFTINRSPKELRWPEEPLRTSLIRGLAKLGVARFTRKYPGVTLALVQSLLATVCKYYRIVLGWVLGLSTAQLSCSCCCLFPLELICCHGVFKLCFVVL